jgi:hypothetical protein
MGPRSVGSWLTACLLLAGCGSNPGQELANDYAADFAGVWYGTGTYTYLQNGQPTSTHSQVIQPLVVVTGKNALQLPEYCSASDQGVSAKVTAPTHFEMQPYDCPLNTTSSCPFRVKMEHGGGTLSGSTLQMDFHGTIVQPPNSGCQLVTIGYDLVFSGTHTPSSTSEKPSAPENVMVLFGEK